MLTCDGCLVIMGSVVSGFSGKVWWYIELVGLCELVGLRVLSWWYGRRYYELGVAGV